MQFRSLKLDGSFHIEGSFLQDERGYFLRTFCEKEFSQKGLNTHWPQVNLTNTLKKGTIRGFHYQRDPWGEIKLIRCVSGKAYDVIVDCRRESKTFGQWESFELDSEKPSLLYVPKGFAHGFQTRTDNCQLLYLMSATYMPDFAVGIRWDDSTLKVEWPEKVTSISEKDAKLPGFDVLPT
jgi:dTDP-4-dehydrorhamnose 3,5-epimerase